MKMKKVVEEPEELDMAREEVFDSFQSPESSLVASAHYNHQTRELEVTLRPSTVKDHEKTYLYCGVEPKVWGEFMTAASKGAYFSRYIRPMFTAKLKG